MIYILLDTDYDEGYAEIIGIFPFAESALKRVNEKKLTSFRIEGWDFNADKYSEKVRVTSSKFCVMGNSDKEFGEGKKLIESCTREEVLKEMIKAGAKIEQHTETYIYGVKYRENFPPTRFWANPIEWELGSFDPSCYPEFVTAAKLIEIKSDAEVEMARIKYQVIYTPMDAAE
jgi:hypothetical protein